MGMISPPQRNASIQSRPIRRKSGGALKGMQLVVFGGLLVCVLLLFGLLLFNPGSGSRVAAAPIPPPDGMPKLTNSTMTVSPTLAATGGMTLTYTIDLRNTGAYTAAQVRVANTIPISTTYNNDGQASAPPPPVFVDPTLSWMGEVGFDSVVQVRFSVTIDPEFTGMIENSAVITEATTGEIITVTARTLVTDQSIFTIKKTALPELPGANKPMTYTLTVTNIGQPATNLPITVTDTIPADTTLLNVGPDGNAQGGIVTWNRSVTLDTGETSVFTFSVTIDDVPEGTIITNDTYGVSDPTGSITTGAVYTTTVVAPALSIHKRTEPDPPGSNGPMTYELTVLNTGSLATSLVITDRVPTGVTYVSGGTFANGVVTWNFPSLDTGQTATFSYTVSIGDVAGVSIENANYGVCSAEGACDAGDPLTSSVEPPNFALSAIVDPIAKKPGGGNSPVTPTLVIENLGPGSAIDAVAFMKFERISVQGSDLMTIPARGTFSPGPTCGTNCVSYLWVGDIASSETITITTIDGQSSQGGAEGTLYTATLVITDQLDIFVTEPVSVTAIGNITHLANLIPSKSAPEVIAAGQMMTYTITVFNSGQSHDALPAPVLTDTLPLSTTLVSISDGGTSETIGESTVISWTLPALSTGASLVRQFTVQVNNGLSPGTEIVNNDYATRWFNAGSAFVLAGEPFTTTIEEVGLIDSFKTVEPVLAQPAEHNVLTYTIHVVNTGAVPLSGVKVYDVMPWQDSTYQRDAHSTTGTVISDVVSLNWTGSVAPFSSELITFTVVVDPFFSGAITNTAVITHPNLAQPVTVDAVAYITEDPVLRISKVASPSPLNIDNSDIVEYTITAVNLGQQATNLVITDTLPLNTQYVAGSATDGGQLIGDTIQWLFPVLEPGDTHEFRFKVRVNPGGTEIVNEFYGITSAEGIAATGPAVVTEIHTSIKRLLLPTIRR